MAKYLKVIHIAEVQFGRVAEIKLHIISFTECVTDVQQAEFGFVNKAKAGAGKLVINIQRLVFIFYKSAIYKKEQI